MNIAGELITIEVKIIGRDGEKIFGKTSMNIPLDGRPSIFDGIYLEIFPKSNISLIFSTNKFPKKIPPEYYNLIFQKDMYETWNDGSYHFIIPIQMRSCQIGEVFHQNLKKCVDYNQS